MNPQNQSGSFGSVLNDGGALGRALSRRQGGEPTSALSQVSPSISTGEGTPPAPPTGSAMPQSMPRPSMSSGSTAGAPEDEKILIIKALSNRLSSISKAEQGPQM